MRPVIRPRQHLLTVLLVALLVVPPVLDQASPASGAGSRGSRSTLFSTDFESGASDWTTGGAKNEWELGSPSDGPGYCHSGTKCWGTDLDSTYGSEANEWLQSPTVDLYGAKSAIIDYWHWYDFSNLMGIMVDVGYIEITANGGTSYDTLWNFTNTTADQDWQEVSIDLGDYLGKKVAFRFRLVTDEMWEESGWFIDDVKVRVNETGPGTPEHDLAVTGITTSPAAPNAGQSTEVPVLVHNAGDMDESGGIVKLTVQDSRDMTTVFSEKKETGLVVQGATNKLVFIWKPMDSTTFILTATVSIEKDAHPGNDTMTAKVAVGRFNHDVAIISFTNDPKSPTVGMNTKLSATVKNLGSMEVSRLRVHLQIRSSTDMLAFEDMRPIDSIEPNTVRTVEFNWAPTAPDLYIARVRTDIKDDPTLEDNIAELYILVAVKGVDMAVVEVWTNPKDAAPNVLRNIKARTMNAGDTPAQGVKIDYNVTGPTGVLLEGTQDYAEVASGEVKQTEWTAYPTVPGIYTVNVRVYVVGDVEPDNDRGSATFSVHSVYRDVGVESLSVVPRTADAGISRTILAEVGNYGDMEESFRTTIRVNDPSSTTVLTKDFDLVLEPGQKAPVTTDLVPVTNGNYTVTATTYLGQDAQPANDQAFADFTVAPPKHHDLGIETLSADPRTGYSDQVRTLTATISNNGEVSEDGLVWFNIYDPTGAISSSFNRSVSLAAGALSEVYGPFLPSGVGSYDVVVNVTIQGAAIDEVPFNDRMNITLLSEQRPPAVDLTIDGMSVSPDPGQVGRGLMLTVYIANLGTEAAEGTLNIRITDPSGGATELTGSFAIQPKGFTNLVFEAPSNKAGTYHATGEVKAVGGVSDANPLNDHKDYSFTVVDVGIRDAAVAWVGPGKSGDCSRSFFISVQLDNKGTVDLGNVTVRLEVTGNGQSLAFNKTTILPKGALKVTVSFSFTLPVSGTYQLTARVIATGDSVPGNDVRTVTERACDPGTAHVTTSTEESSSPWLVLVLIIVIACVVIAARIRAEMARDRARLPPRAPREQRPPTTTEFPEQIEPVRPARPPPRRPPPRGRTAGRY